MQCNFNPEPLTTVSVRLFEKCGEDGSPVFKTVSVQTYTALSNLTVLQFNRMAEIEAQQCKECNATATIPEWWAVRKGANRPQAAVLYAEVKPTGKLGNGRWVLHIPHYNRPKGAKPSLPRYAKGDWRGVLTLADNSKIVVNASTASECKRVINKLKILVPARYRMEKGKAIRPKIFEEDSDAYKKCDVIPVRLDFYSNGRENRVPDWSIDLRKK